MFRFDIIVRSYFQSNKWHVKDFILRFFYGTHLPTDVIFQYSASTVTSILPLFYWTCMYTVKLTKYRNPMLYEKDEKV